MVEKIIGGASSNCYQLGGRQCGKLFAAHFLIAQIASDQAGIGLTDFNKQLTRLVVGNARDVEARVGLTVTKYWDMQHGKISDCGFQIADFA